MNAVTMLGNRMLSAGTLACCGLDPDVRKFPQGLTGSDSERAFGFLAGVVEAAGPSVCCYKAQKAFFDLLPDGHDVLQEIIELIHLEQPGTPVFVDCKVGDIGNTMECYTEIVFGQLDADGIVVNPFMGDEVLDAFNDYPDKAVIVLARTSNPGAAIIQDALLEDGRPVWQYILDLMTQRWNKHENLIPVISSTAGLDLSMVRGFIPNDMPILLAGVGAQGGDVGDLTKLLNPQGTGVFVNSSRGILYPTRSRGGAWMDDIARAAQELKHLLNEARK